MGKKYLKQQRNGPETRHTAFFRGFNQGDTVGLSFRRRCLAKSRSFLCLSRSACNRARADSTPCCSERIRACCGVRGLEVAISKKRIKYLLPCPALPLSLESSPKLTTGCFNLRVKLAIGHSCLYEVQRLDEVFGIGDFHCGLAFG